jgi:hypothetical protein
MENLFLFAAKGLGIASIFFPKCFQQALPKKSSGKPSLPGGFFRREKPFFLLKPSYARFLFFKFLHQLQHGVHGFVFAVAFGSKGDGVVHGEHLAEQTQHAFHIDDGVGKLHYESAIVSGSQRSDLRGDFPVDGAHGFQVQHFFSHGDFLVSGRLFPSGGVSLLGFF